MEYSKLLLVLCLIIALTKAIPVPPANPSEVLGENEPLNNDEAGLAPEVAPANEEEQAEIPQVTEVEAPNFEEKQEPEGEPAPEQIQEAEEVPETEQTVAAEPAQEPAQEEPIFVDPEADQEPQDISADTNTVVSENIGNITNDILGSVSFNIKSALEEELGTEANDEATNGLINNVIVDVLSKTSDDIKEAVGKILENDMNSGDNFQGIAADAASKVAEVLGHNVLTSIASNINFNLDFENISKNVLSSTTENVQKFIEKNLEASKAVVDSNITNDSTLTNDSSEDVTVSNATDIATMVTNGVSYLIKSTLCEALGAEAKDSCENVANSVIVSVAGVLNDIVKNSINSASGNGLNIACSAIPAEVFQQLTGVVTEAVSSQIGKDQENGNISNIANSVLTLIINSVEKLLCDGRTDSTEENGSVIIKDITGLATHIINKVNNINDDVVSTLNNEKQESETTSGSIISSVSGIQEGIKSEANGEQPAEEKPAEEQPAEEQPAEEQQPTEEQPAEEQPAEEQQAVDAEVVPQKLAFKRPENMPYY